MPDITCSWELSYKRHQHCFPRPTTRWSRLQAYGSDHVVLSVRVVCPSSLTSVSEVKLYAKSNFSNGFDQAVQCVAGDNIVLQNVRPLLATGKIVGTTYTLAGKWRRNMTFGLRVKVPCLPEVKQQEGDEKSKVAVGCSLETFF